MEVEDGWQEGGGGHRVSDIELIERPKLGVASSSTPSTKEGRRNRGDWDGPVKSPTKRVAVTTKRMVDLDIADSDENEEGDPRGSMKKHGVCCITVLIRRIYDPYIISDALCHPMLWKNLIPSWSAPCAILNCVTAKWTAILRMDVRKRLKRLARRRGLIYLLARVVEPGPPRERKALVQRISECLVRAAILID